MVAWKDSRESARAVRDAWPILSTAEEVAVVCVRAKKAGEEDLRLLSHLELHGCKVRLIVNDRNDAPPSDLIKLEMGKTSSDLLVMGLYGRPRVQELVLGGVSEDLLRNVPFPILVSH
jgi:nucleotide-binding universal stress UspA family protein